MKLVFFKITLADFIVTSALVANALCFSILTYSHFHRRTTRISNSAPIGVMNYKFNVVLRKYEGRFIWDTLEATSDIYLNDFILTKDRSDAVISLHSGVKIFLDPNSLIKLEIIDNNLSLLLSEGVMRVNANSSDNAMMVRTATGVATEVNNVNATFTQTEEGSNVFVKSGHLTIGDKEIDANKVLQLGVDGKWRMLKVDIVDLYPQDGLLLLTEKQIKTINLKWETKVNVSKFTVVLSREPTFTQKKTYNVQGKQNLSISLKEGTWYWQIISRGTKKEYISVKQSFTLQLYRSPLFLYPQENTLIPAKEGDPIVFKWDSKDNSKIGFNVAEDKGFKKIVISKILTGNTYSTTKLKKGTYYWRVQPDYQKKFILDKSVEAQQKAKKNYFVVNADIKFLKKPSNLKPRSVQWLYPGLKQDINFLWNSVPGTRYYKVSIFIDNTRKPIVTKNVQSNFFSYPVDWTTKFIYWTVQAHTVNKDKLTLSSKVASAKAKIKYKIPLAPKVIASTYRSLD